MKLSAPKNSVWIVAVVLGVLGILGKFVAIPYVSQYAFAILAVGFVILAIACLLKNV
ncbi:MAG: hypothetical protein IKQ46_05395 [Bacteroidales bacterium]|nr:hypothetical protein [Bacteroidales bacterium]